MKTIHSSLALTAALAAFAVGSAPALAQATTSPGQLGAMPMTAAAGAAEMSDGEVRKIDKEQGKLTLKHGEIKNLDMPGMTMVFTAKDKAMLDGIKVGDKVKFKATNEGGKLVVVELVPAK